MLPEFNFLGLSLSSYGFFTAIGIILLAFVIVKLSLTTEIEIHDTIVSIPVVFLSAFLGAHLLFGITNIPYIIEIFSIYQNNHISFDDFIEIIMSCFSGMVFYGGLIFGILGGFLFCKIRKINIDHFADIYAVAIPLFHCFGRIGCFLSGCCYGIESEFGVTTTNALIDSCNNVSRFPVQLLESFLNLLLFIALYIFFKKVIFRNNLIFVYLTIYSVIRFCDEFLRGDELRGIWASLSTSQWISICLFVISTFALIFRINRTKTSTYR